MTRRKKTRSVLVVNDDPAVLIFLGRLLDRAGARVLFARSASAAIAIAAREYVPIDLILSNVMLPGLSGPETVNRVRAIRHGLPALYMSAYTDHGVIRIDLMHSGYGEQVNDRRQTFLETIEKAAACHPAPAARYQYSHQAQTCLYQ